jgi:Mg2+-importing ATPase
MAALATGPKTMFGDIAVRVRSRAPETEFEHGLRRFSLLILRTTVVLVLFILLMSLAFKRDGLESLLFLIPVSVAYLALVDIAKRQLARRLGL